MASVKRASKGKPTPPSAASLKPLPLRVDPEKFPNLRANPSLERALRIRQALDQGRPRDEAVALADLAVGPRGHLQGRPKASGRPASGPRPGGKKQPPERKPAVGAPARKRKA